MTLHNIHYAKYIVGWIHMAVAAALAWLLSKTWLPQPGQTDRMSTDDTHDRLDLTGADFDFQAGHTLPPGRPQPLDQRHGAALVDRDTHQASLTSTPAPVLDRAALALQDWREASGVIEGAIFWRLWKQRVGPALSTAAVGEIVQQRTHLAGPEGCFGGHSVRSGFLTEASHQGVALPANMQLTEPSSVSSVMGYFQAGGATADPAACDWNTGLF